MLLVSGLAILAARTGTAKAQTAGQTFYVSRSGNNADGTTWASAWNELSQINWSVIQPGDTILIDGGAVACPELGPGYNCGMVYNSTLTIGRSGTQLLPITLRLADETGRNGTAIIDGGLTTWSTCAEAAAEPTPPSAPGSGGTRDTGVTFGTSMWIILDGTRWGGIEIRNHSRYGVNLAGSQHVIARYLKVHHNTDPVNSLNNAIGVTQNYLSAYNTLARSEIFRNGQDALRGAGDYFTFEESFVHDQYCNHPDGIQSFVPTSNADVPDSAGEVVGLVMRRNVFDHIGLQTIFLGENATHQSWNRAVTIESNLFLDNDYVIKSKHASTTDWTIQYNTFVSARDFGLEWCCATPGARAPMVVSNNIFSQIKEGTTAFYMPTGNGTTTFAGNCLYRTGSRSGNYTESGTIVADPGFVNPAGGDYALSPGSACAGKGSAITSVNQLLTLTRPSRGRSPVDPTATNTPVPPTATRVAPTATATSVPPTATATPILPTSTATVQPTPGGSNLTLAPSADAYVDAAYPSTNYGTSAIVRSYVSPEQRSYFRFVVAGLGGRPVARATFRIYANGYSDVGFSLRAVTDSTWGETAITYRRMPALGTLVGSIGAHSGARYVDVDLTPYITGEGTFSFALTTTSPKAVSYPSREAAANPPQLVLDLAPAPAPTSTALPPMATATGLPPTATQANTPLPPTATMPPAATSTPLPGGSLTLAPEADTYADQGQPGTALGNSTILRTDGSSRDEQRSYLRFAVTGLLGRPVTRAVLRVYANGSSNDGFRVVAVADNSWTEAGLTYATCPPAGSEIAVSGSHRAGAWVTVDVTPYIRGDGTFSLALVTSSTKGVSYPSREANANQPQLVVDYSTGTP